MLGLELAILTLKPMLLIEHYPASPRENAFQEHFLTALLPNTFFFSTLYNFFLKVS